MTKNHVLLVLVIAIGVLLGIGGMGIGVYFVFQAAASPRPREPLRVRLDRTGPYLILATETARRDFGVAIQQARELHPEATYLTFSADSVESVPAPLRELQPKYALIVIKPVELDVNFAWKWLGITTRIDDDPFVDVSSGFITGATPEAASELVDRTAAAVRGERQMPGKLIDNLGPNTQAAQHRFFQRRGCFMIPVYGERVALASISHGATAFTSDRLDSMHDAGFIHLGGHGHPNRIVDGINGRQAKMLRLSPCIVFNGACYTGVTHRWFDQWTENGIVSEQTVAAEDCFCLNLLENSAIAYLAALHPDHGIPVYQEMEYLAYTGMSLGEVMRHTHNGVILGNAGELPALGSFSADTPSPQWSPSDVMLKGTAARVLFGDPALIVSDAFTKRPFDVSASVMDSNRLQVTAVLANTALKSEYTDTYHADLASNKQLFNDRALIRVDLPDGWENVETVTVSSVRVDGQELRHRLVGYVVEAEDEVRRLHVQVDMPTSGYMQSRFRRAVRQWP